MENFSHWIDRFDSLLTSSSIIRSRNYSEALARFGFEHERNDVHSHEGRPEPENPIDSFNIELVKDILTERTIGELHPHSKFVNEVVWGTEPGAIRLWINTGYGVYMDRMGLDLLGQPKWYTKKYFQINRHGYGGYEETVTQELYNHLQEIYRSHPDSPKQEYHGLMHLAISLAEKIKRTCRPIFLFDQIRKINDNRYLVCFNLRGQGVQAPDQKRVEKNITEVLFYPSEGTVRIFNTNYESPLGQHTWEIAPTHSDFCFFPTQTQEEMIEPIATVLRFY